MEDFQLWLQIPLIFVMKGRECTFKNRKIFNVLFCKVVMRQTLCHRNKVKFGTMRKTRSTQLHWRNTGRQVTKAKVLTLILACTLWRIYNLTILIDIGLKHIAYCPAINSIVMTTHSLINVPKLIVERS